MPSRQYPVELKITLSGDIEDALERLQMKGPRSREVWFLEDDTPGLRPGRVHRAGAAPGWSGELPPEDIPLLKAGVILRLRTDSKQDQSTVKLRPARRSQLVDRWREPFEDGDEEYRIEGDWAGKRMLAASCVAEFSPGTFDGLMTGDSDLSTAFTERQLEFIAECVDIPLNISTLTAYAPIAATQWKDQELGDVEVNGERWTVDDLDFLELSARVVHEDDATQRQADFVAAVRDNGLIVA